MSKAREIMDQIKALNLANKDDLNKWADLHAELMIQLMRDFEVSKRALPISAENDSMAAEIQRIDRQWIKCSERLPLEPDGSVTFETVKVLVSDDCGRVYAAEFARGGGHVGMPWAEWAHNDVESHIITHWMPLPNPPEESE